MSEHSKINRSKICEVANCCRSPTSNAEFTGVCEGPYRYSQECKKMLLVTLSRSLQDEQKHEVNPWDVRRGQSPHQEHPKATAHSKEGGSTPRIAALARTLILLLKQGLLHGHTALHPRNSPANKQHHLTASLSTLPPFLKNQTIMCISRFISKPYFKLGILRQDRKK